MSVYTILLTSFIYSDSTLTERMHHFRFLISLIGGESEPSLQNQEIDESNMPSMPLHNYEGIVQFQILYFLRITLYFLLALLKVYEQYKHPLKICITHVIHICRFVDLPRSAIVVWCDFFLNLSSEAKTKVMEMMWGCLSNEERTAVITDLRQFISMSINSRCASDVEESDDVSPAM